MRFRSIAFSEPTHRKAAFINKKLHSDRHALNAYIVFKSKEAADKALTANGHVFMDRHLRVDNAAEPKVRCMCVCVCKGEIVLTIHVYVAARSQTLSIPWIFAFGCGRRRTVGVFQRLRRD